MRIGKKKVVLPDTTKTVTVAAADTTKTTEQAALPVVEETKETKQTDTDKPIEGYYVEKTSEVKDDNENENDNDDDDDIDTNVHPDERIQLKYPSIALNTVSNKLTTALDQAVDRASNSGIEDDDKTDRFFVQAQTLSEDKDPNAIFKMDFKKGFEIYGKNIIENMNYKYDDSEVKIKMNQFSQKLELGSTFSSKSGNTKAVFIGSATRSTTNLKDFNIDLTKNNETDYSNINEEDLDIKEEDLDITPEIPETKETESVYIAYLAGQHTFKNNDILTGNAFGNYDEIQESKTAAFNADYYLNKYKAHMTAGVTLYSGPNDVKTSKLNFNCTFNPESHEDYHPEMQTEYTSESTTEDATNALVNQTSLAKTDKKWQTAVSPFFETNAIEGSPEEGLGIKIRSKRLNDNSSARIYSFAKFSTTQREDEANLYHLTGGIGAKYRQSIGANGVLEAKADVKDKYTFKEGNILTATGNVKYSSTKVSAEVEGKYIRVPNSSYAGVSGRVSYTPNKNIYTYAEASYLNWRYPEGKLSGSSVNAGILVNLEALQSSKKHKN